MEPVAQNSEGSGMGAGVKSYITRPTKGMGSSEARGNGPDWNEKYV